MASLIEPGDVEAALQTAAAIGDDTLQQQAQGHVVPDSFTHGTSAQRQRWFSTGLKAGTVAACNTFAAAQLVDGTTCPASTTSRQFVPLKIAVLTVSDTRELADDKSGATLPSASRRPATRSPARAIVTDDVEKIRAQVQGLDRRHGDRRDHHDRRHRLHRPRRDAGGGRAAVREAHGRLRHDVPHGEPRARSAPRAIQSRATAGVAGATYIFCLPGSPGACQDAWDEILVHQLDYRYRPCNFVEIMPRLDEHLRRPKAKGATA